MHRKEERWPQLRVKRCLLQKLSSQYIQKVCNDRNICCRKISAIHRDRVPRDAGQRANHRDEYKREPPQVYGRATCCLHRHTATRRKGPVTQARTVRREATDTKPTQRSHKSEQHAAVTPTVTFGMRHLWPNEGALKHAAQQHHLAHANGLPDIPAAASRVVPPPPLRSYTCGYQETMPRRGPLLLLERTQVTTTHAKMVRRSKP